MLGYVEKEEEETDRELDGRMASDNSPTANYTKPFKWLSWDRCGKKSSTSNLMRLDER